MKHEATLEAENNYTVAEDELARELLPLVKDYFTAEAEETGRGTLLATFTNGEKFETGEPKLQYLPEPPPPPRRIWAGAAFFPQAKNKARRTRKENRAKFCYICAKAYRENLKIFCYNKGTEN